MSAGPVRMRKRRCCEIAGSASGLHMTALHRHLASGRPLAHGDLPILPRKRRRNLGGLRHTTQTGLAILRQRGTAGLRQGATSRHRHRANSV